MTISFGGVAANVTQLEKARRELNPPKTVSSTTYTLLSTDGVLNFTHASGCAITGNAGLNVGQVIVCNKRGAGAISLTAGTATFSPAGVATASGTGGSIIVVGTETADTYTVISSDAGGDIGSYATWAALQAAYPNDGAALLALPKGASVWVEEFISGTGRGGRMFRSFDGAYWTAPHPITLVNDQRATDVLAMTACNGAITWTASNSGGITRITASGAHGLTAAMNAKSLNASAWSGTGTAGLFPMTYVSATVIDFAGLAWDAGRGNPTITPISTDATVITVTIPAAMARAMSNFEAMGTWNMTFTGTGPHYGIDISGTNVAYGQVNSQSTFQDRRNVMFRNSISAECTEGDNAGGGYGASTNVMEALSFNSASTWTISYKLRVNTVNTFIELIRYRVTAEI